MDADKLQASGSRDLDTPLPSIGARDPTLPRELVAIVDQLPREAQGRALSRTRPSCSPICRRSSRRGGALRRGSLPVSRARGVRRGRREVLLRPQQRDPHRARAARGVAAARGDRPVGRRQVVVRARRPRPGACARAGGALAGARAAPGPRAAASASRRSLDEALATGERQPDLIAQLAEAPGLFGELLRQARGAQQAQACSSSSISSRSCSRCATTTRRASCSSPRCSPPPTIRRSPVRVVLSMRADFLDRLAGHKHFLARAVARPVLPDRARPRQPARDARAARRARRLLVRGSVGSSTT